LLGYVLLDRENTLVLDTIAIYSGWQPTLGQESLHGLVVLAEADHHSLRPDTVDVRSQSNLLDVGRGVGIWVELGDIMVGITQVVAVLCDCFLDIAGQAVPEVPAVRYLLGRGCTQAGAFGIRPSTITTNRRNATVAAELLSEAGRGAVREQVDRVVCRRLNAKSSTPSTVIVPIGGPGMARTKRSNVSHPVTRPRRSPRPTPARAATARPIDSNIRRSCGLRRAYALVKPSTCSANVVALHDGLSQKNLRTCRHSTTGNPATGTSATRRW
jgi:hypothetical protein